MKFKKWIILFITFFCFSISVIVGFNYFTDPFGIFGDKIMCWYEYDMTNNPRTAKIGYLDNHHEEYDSYIIGCSKTSSIDVDLLNKYYPDANFYNMIMYGGDMHDIEATAEYLINNYNVKNLIIGIGMEETTQFDVESDEIKENLHAKVDGSSLIAFYSKYLLLNTKYGYNKIKQYFNKEYLPNANSVFLPEKCSYDKKARDVESIVNLEEYLSKTTTFGNTYSGDYSMPYMDKVVESISNIKKICSNKGINFKLIVCPIYYKEMALYSPEKTTEYWRKIAEVTDFWNFAGYNSVNCDERYFYDTYHFRNCIGNMALAKIFGNENVYVAENFGYHITKDNADDQIQKILYNAESNIPKSQYTKDVPIIIYHQIEDDANKANEYSTRSDKFREDMEKIKALGYTTVTFDDLYKYVETKAELPEKPIIITFDDGYLNNYKYAYPILKELGMQATISIVGNTVGKDKLFGEEIKPHFDYAQAKEMYESGVIDIESHSFDLHYMEPRKGSLQMQGENTEEYIEVFRNDVKKSIAEIEKNVGNKVTVFTYPYGGYSVLSEALLKEIGVKATLSTNAGINTVVKGLPQSLIEMRRTIIASYSDAEWILNNLSN